MLLGRETELGLIEGLLERAGLNRSGILVLSGEPGIGKTALLDHARNSAKGFSVLEARGFESESEFAFSGLADLVRPKAASTASPSPRPLSISSPRVARGSWSWSPTRTGSTTPRATS